jgi:hypothetical protein
MSFFNSTKLNLTRCKPAAMVLGICFSMMVLFGSPLHDHDLESSHVDLDCISCHLVHAKVGLDHDEPDLFLETQETQFLSITTAPRINFTASSLFPRAPPIIC